MKLAEIEKGPCSISWPCVPRLLSGRQKARSLRDSRLSCSPLSLLLHLTTTLSVDPLFVGYIPFPWRVCPSSPRLRYALSNTRYPDRLAFCEKYSSGMLQFLWIQFALKNGLLRLVSACSPRQNILLDRTPEQDQQDPPLGRRGNQGHEERLHGPVWRLRAVWCTRHSHQ